MFQLLRTNTDLFVDQRAQQDRILWQIYFFNWYQGDNLHVWLFLEPVDHRNIATCCLASYICHYDVIQDLTNPSVSSDE